MIQYVRHNVPCGGLYTNLAGSVLPCISQHPLDPRTTFRQITPIPLIEYISIYQRRVSPALFVPCFYTRNNGMKPAAYFSPNHLRQRVTFISIVETRYYRFDTTRPNYRDTG